MNARSPAPAPFSSRAPAPFYSPAPAPFPQQALIAPSSSEEEETETECSANYEEESEASDFIKPTPAPAPPAPFVISTPQPQPISIIPPPSQPIDNPEQHESEVEPEEEGEEEETPPSPHEDSSEEPMLNGEIKNLKAAAVLIHTLDTAYAHANKATATTALDADEARTAQRTAAEIVRRYTTQSHPKPGSDLTNSFERDSPASAYRSGKSPVMSTSGSSAAQSSFSTSFFPSNEPPSIDATTADKTGSEASSNNNNLHSIYFSRPSPSNRIVSSRSEDALALSLELERIKLALEAERMAHDETKNLLAEEKSKNSHLQQKLQRLESNMETQRESLGRSGDALEEELRQAQLRVELAEEDAQLALDFAKQSDEEREILEQRLEEAMAEIYTLKQQHLSSTVEQQQSSEDEETPVRSILKSVDEGTEGKRSVHFSDPISFSNSPTGESFLEDEEPEEPHYEASSQLVTAPMNILTPSRPGRPLVSAGRKLLQQSVSKDNGGDSTIYSFEYTPEKSAERRQRLRETLKQLDSAVVIPTPLTGDRSPHRKQLQFSTNVLELCKSASETLRASGKRLQLDGHWWKETKDNGADETPLDSLARQYCQSVEVKISRQKNEISELESLCSFLEESVASSATGL